MSVRARRFSLRTRLTVLLALAVLVVLGGAARIVDLRADSDMRQRFDVSVLARANSLEAAIEAGRGRLHHEVGAAVGVFPGTSGHSWYALRCGGRVVARTAQVPPKMPVADTPTFADARLAGRSLRVVALRFHPAHPLDGAQSDPAASCVLRYGVDRDPLAAILHTLDFTLLGSLLGACAVVLLATPWLVQRGLHPLSGLADAMTDIGPDAAGSRLPASSTTELVPLVTRFNQVLARMDDGLARERQFAAGVAHEFRTRLAELRTLAEVEMRYPSGRNLDMILGEVGNIGAELEATVTALLQLTRIESGLEPRCSENVVLAPLLERVVARHRDGARRHAAGIELEFACERTYAVSANPALLEIVLDNLLGNAVAYAPTGTAVTVYAEGDRIEVRNHAPGLYADDLVNFGQRFWRKGGEAAGHAGLGLALAGAAVRALGMDLSFQLSEGVLRAKLRLPA